MLAEIDKDARDIAALQETTQRLASNLQGVQSHLKDHLDPMEKLMNGHVRELAFLRGENASSKLDLQSIRDAGQKAEARLESENKAMTQSLSAMNRQYSMLIDMLTKLELQRKEDDMKPFLINADTGEEIVLDLLPGYEFFGQYKGNGPTSRERWWQQKVGQSYFPAGIPFSLVNHALIQLV